MIPEHRSDIQGLRGIAVLLVVLYHSETVFPGGFIGVDVFFVISGYVIMKSLLVEFKASSTISWRKFLARRINRLLPASSIVVAFTLIISIFVFSPFSEQAQIAKTSLSSTFFITNIFFIFQNSYSALVNNPLRHMWSLGVEEQFYIFLIITISLIIHFSKKKEKALKQIFFFAVTTCLLSFIANIVLSAGIRMLPLPTRIAFFSPVTRIWEILLGVIAAFISLKFTKDQKQNLGYELISVSGICLVMYSALTFDSFTAFPGLHALVPTIGGLLLVLFAGKSLYVVRLLSFKPIRYLGDLSYSWYLWHWPIIVFTKIQFPGNQGLLLFAGLGSLLPSVCTYHLIENRFRFSNSNYSNFPFRTLLISLLSQVTLAFLVIAGATTSYGLTLETQSGVTASWAAENGCEMHNNVFPIETCFQKYGDSSPTVLLVGDSQAGAISDGVRIAAESLEYNFAVWYLPACPFFPRATIGVENCSEFHVAIEKLLDQINPSIFLVANKSTLYTTAGPQGGGYALPKLDGKMPMTYSDSIENWIGGLQSELARPVYSNIKMVLFQQVPSSPSGLPTLLSPSSKNIRFDLGSNLERNKLVTKEREELSDINNLEFLDPAEAICPNGSCRQTVDNQATYSDAFHLSKFGSSLLSEHIQDFFESISNK